MALEEAMIKDLIARVGRLEEEVKDKSVPPQYSEALRVANLALSAIVTIMIDKKLTTQEEFSKEVEREHFEMLKRIQGTVDGQTKADQGAEENSNPVQEEAPTQESR